MTEPERYFKVLNEYIERWPGSRVRLEQDIGQLPAGSLGVVMRVMDVLTSMVSVRFDDFDDYAIVIEISKLERLS